MSDKRVIPETPLVRRYRFFDVAKEGERRAQAEYFAENPGQLAREFAQSVRHFESYDNVGEDFFDKRSPDPEPVRGPIERTHHLASRLKQAGSVTPVEPANEGSDVPGVRGVRAVRAEELGFDYVERELAVTRTTDARWERGASGSSRLALDLLLSAHDGRLPIAAEVKIGPDKDAYYAFIQALACLACLATPTQYERLCRHVGERGRWPQLADPPRLDLYLLFVESPVTGAHQDAIKRAVAQLAAGLVGEPRARQHLRRVVALDVNRDGDLQVTVRFAWEAAETEVAAAR